MNWINRLLRGLACGVIAAGLCAPALAYPDRPITVIVPYPPGGGADALLRTVSTKLGEQLGARIVIDNRGGGGGNVGIAAVARSAPDGYTLGFPANVQMSINPGLYANLGFDPDRDLTPVGMVGRFFFLLVAHPSTNITDLKSLIATARTRDLFHGSSGNGSPQHLAGAIFNTMADVKLKHVPYRGTGPSMNDLLAGTTQVQFATIPVVQQHVEAGKLRPIAVSSPRRQPSLPNVPTLDESGLKGFEVDAWYALYAPAGTPPDIVRKINEALRRTLADPDLAKRLQEIGIEPLYMTPEETTRRARSDRERWTKVIQQERITID